MRETLRWIAAGAAVVAIGTAVVLVMCWVLTPSPDVAVVRATMIGGFGSAVGGIAAAIAAWRSREAAQASDAVATQVAQIAKQSRDALARAIKPRLSFSFSGDHDRDAQMTVSNESAWPAREVEVRVEFPTGTLLKEWTVDQIGSMDQGRSGGSKSEVLPVIPHSIYEQAVMKSFQGEPVQQVVEGVATIKFRDSELLRAYANVYSLTLWVVDKDYFGEVFIHSVSSRPLDE